MAVIQSSRKTNLKMSANVRFFLSAVLAIYFFRNTLARGTCFNPNKHKGYCISIKDCPVLLKLVAKPSLSDEEKQFLRDSSCTDGFGDHPLVCCTNDVFYTDGSTSDKLRLVENLLPGLEECGDQPSGSKIYSGKETELDEFPWMALLNYGNDESPEFFCGGTLINSRYVLTAAHCVIQKKVQSVRLGEYDTSKHMDCIESDCADPPIESFVDEIVVHPNYNIKSIHRHNDIALIRLKNEIRYTSFISPICMPSVIGLSRSDVGTNLVAAGWGRTLTEKNSKVKLKVSLPVYGQPECQNAYKRTKVYLLDFQLCAGGKFVEDTCGGDSGGPLMYFKGKWAIEGIVSFSRGCGLENLPGIYTRVSEYEDWIKESLKP